MNLFMYITLITLSSGRRYYDYEYLWCNDDDIVQAKKEVIKEIDQEMLKRRHSKLCIELAVVLPDDPLAAGREILARFLEEHGMELL